MTRLRQFAALAVTTVIALAAAAPGARAQSGRVTGIVINSATRTALPGIAVSLAGTTLSATTDSTGAFSFAQVQPGQYLLRAQVQGLSSVAVGRVRVVADSTATVRLGLSLQGDVIETTTLTTGDVTIQLRNPINVTGRQPLIIIDGVIQNDSLTARPLPRTIPPDRIDSIEVVKGAAAVALYGERAQNGVIVIRTKRQPPPRG